MQMKCGLLAFFIIFLIVSISPVIGLNAHDAVLELNMDEPTGSISFNDISGNNNNANCVSCPKAGFEGIIGTSLYFNTENYLIVPGSDSLGMTNAIAIEAWIYPLQYSSYNRIITKERESFVLRLENGFPVLYFIADHLYKASADTKLSKNNWYQIIGTWDSQEKKLKIYINGKETSYQQQDVFDGPLNSIKSDLYISTPTESFLGIVDKIAIYDRSLNSNEILLKYKNDVKRLRYIHRSIDRWHKQNMRSAVQEKLCFSLHHYSEVFYTPTTSQRLVV
ncbi:MAG: LamG domain-containing protein [Candidatus Aenigmarchaeota archaeon]|nr:LamG domain-containing protein [Candidatus Aenigmarchaeota archaeon]